MMALAIVGASWKACHCIEGSSCFIQRKGFLERRYCSTSRKSFGYGHYVYWTSIFSFEKHAICYGSSQRRNDQTIQKKISPANTAQHGYSYMESYWLYEQIYNITSFRAFEYPTASAAIWQIRGHSKRLKVTPPTALCSLDSNGIESKHSYFFPTWTQKEWNIMSSKLIRGVGTWIFLSGLSSCTRNYIFLFVSLYISFGLTTRFCLMLWISYFWYGYISLHPIPAFCSSFCVKYFYPQIGNYTLSVRN